jgi:hypothetical protein
MALLTLLVLAAATPLPPAALERDVRALIGIRSSTAPSLLPDGKQVAFLSNVIGSPQVWTVSTAGGWPELVTTFDDPVSGVEWSPAGDCSRRRLLRAAGSGRSRTASGPVVEMTSFFLEYLSGDATPVSTGAAR